MIRMNMLPDILKFGKMVLNIEPFFLVELEILNGEYILRAYLYDTEENYEYKIMPKYSEKEYENLYDLFSDLMFYGLKYLKKLLTWRLEKIDLKTDPRTVGFFNKNTYNKIMHGSWAGDTVIFECEKMDGDTSDTKYASVNCMREEAVKRLKLLGVSKDQIEDYENKGIIPCVAVEKDKITVGRLESNDVLRTISLYMDKGYNVYYAIRQKSFYMNGTEFEKLTFLVVVGDYRSWNCSRKKLEENMVEAYVVNPDIPEYSELCEIKVENNAGRLITFS